MIARSFASGLIVLTLICSVPVRAQSIAPGSDGFVEVAVGEAKAERIRMYIARPKTAEGRTPTILILHGGGGFLQEHIGVADAFARQGYVAAAICVWRPDTSLGKTDLRSQVSCPNAPRTYQTSEHRVNGFAHIFGPPAQQTLHDAREYLFTLPFVDTSNFFVWGQSTGAALALIWAGRGGASTIKKVIACAPPLYFDSFPKPPSTFDKFIARFYPEFGVQVPFLPEVVIPELKVPVLLMHGRLDQVVNFQESVRFADELKNAGGSVTTMFLDNIGHHNCWQSPRGYIDQWVSWLKS